MSWKFYVTYSGPDLASPPAPVGSRKGVTAWLDDDEWMVCDLSPGGVVFARASGREVEHDVPSRPSRRVFTEIPCPFPVDPPRGTAGEGPKGLPFLVVRRSVPGKPFAVTAEPWGDCAEVADGAVPLYLFMPGHFREDLGGFELEIADDRLAILLCHSQIEVHAGGRRLGALR